MIVVITVFIMVLLFGLYSYYGGFYNVKVRTETVGGETMVYKKVTGDYKQTSSVTNEVYNYLLHDLGIETHKGVGIFYDNPKLVKRKSSGRKSAALSYPPTSINWIRCFVNMK